MTPENQQKEKTLTHLEYLFSELDRIDQQRNHAETLLKDAFEYIALDAPMRGIETTLRELEYGFTVMRHTLTRLRIYADVCRKEIAALE